MNAVKTKRSLSLDVCQPLVGRNFELEKISDFILNHVKNESPASIYISGVPGVGKTATVKRSLQNLKMDIDIELVWINCMELNKATDLNEAIYNKLNKSRKRTNGKQCKNVTQLERLFTSSAKMIVLCLDEIDSLMSNNQEVLYAAFNWTNLPKSRLVLLGIANAFDLTERVLPKLRFKNAIEPILLQFQPYSKDQVVEILKFRLCHVYNIIDEAAVEMCARKVSAYTGDIRKALEICKLAVDKYVDVVDENCKVKPKEIIETVNQVYGNKECLVNALTIQQKYILAAVLKLNSSSSKPFTIDELFTTYKSICNKAKMSTINNDEVYFICQALEDFRLISKISKKSQNIFKYQLNTDVNVVKATLNDQAWLSVVLQQ